MDAVGEPQKPVHLQFHFSHCFSQGVVLPSDQTYLLLLSNGGETGGGHHFVLLVTLITPWGIRVVPFSSCSVLISPLPADSSALITVFMLTYVTPSKNIVFLGVIMQKQINVLSNEWSYLVKGVNLNCHTRCCFCNFNDFLKKKFNQVWPCAVDCKYVTWLGKTH